MIEGRSEGHEQQHPHIRYASSTGRSGRFIHSGRRRPPGPGAGFAMAPRLGGNFLIGRSGILTPSLSYQYTTHDSADTGNGVLLQVSSAVRANIGYTIMW